MNFSIRLSFHGVEKEAIISSDTTCLLNVNETSLCQRNETANNNCNVTCDNFEDDRCLYTSVTFWGFVILMVFGLAGYYISISVNDTICFDILGTVGQMKYGKQRLWGSIGYSFMSLVSGYTIDLWSQGKIYKTYTPAFLFMLVFIVIDLICCRKLKVYYTIKRKNSIVVLSRTGDFLRILRHSNFRNRRSFECSLNTFATRTIKFFEASNLHILSKLRTFEVIKSNSPSFKCTFFVDIASS
ncbi:PREDICTED: uncharacterized protein LOC105567622 [Vollenhovia emeryi]|uniref:uncharacterized protein LOC105567622 n=1 Tax=Vollenhovia emeryi TaxID=411798 RepID=UPI0005F3C3ED|nr:PREDICTED: uncharacterized protein LOC105567622 [Vollenhovia emeryi]